jgi:Tfp pilus assembly protein PilO
MMTKIRQGMLLSLAGVVVIGLLYTLLVVSPALSRQRTLKEYASRKQTDLASMLEMKAQWESFQKARAEAEGILRQRGEGFTLLTFLERVSREAGIEKKIRYMKPLSFQEKDEAYKAEGIEMQLEDIDTQRMVDFLLRIEHSNNLLVVERMKVRPVSKGTERLLELTLQVKTYRLNTPEGREAVSVPKEGNAPPAG